MNPIWLFPAFMAGYCVAMFVAIHRHKSRHDARWREFETRVNRELGIR